MGKRRSLSENDATQILTRYSAVTIMGLLREIARCDEATIDWNALMKKTTTGISNAREYQGLWRHIAYGKELADCYADDALPSDDDSDLEFEVVSSPTVTADTSAEVIRWVKADMQRFGMTGKKKGEVSKSKPRDSGLPTVVSQARISSGVAASAVDVSHKGASLALNVSGRDTCTPSLSSKNVSQVSSAPESPSAVLLRGLGQSERKKRKLWSQEEDQELITAVEKLGEGNWTNILKCAFTHDRTAAQLSQRWALIRKRREVQASSNRVTSSIMSASAADGQGNGTLTPPGDPSPRPSIAQNGGNSDNINPPVPPSSATGNTSANRVVAPSTMMASFTSSYGSQSQIQVSSSSNTSLGSTGVSNSVSSMAATTGSVDSTSLKGGTGRPGGNPFRAGMVSSQRQTQAMGSARSTSGSSAAMTTMAASQVRSAGGKSSTGAGAGRLIAPGAVVMSAAAAQAASVGGSEMWQATTLPPAGVLTSGTTKYIRNNAVPGPRSMAAKPMTGPDPGVQAAAVAAGARIAPASAAASLLKAAQSGNVMHIGPGGAPIAKSGLPGQAGMGHNSSVGSRGSSGAIVHYICTGAATPAQGMMLSGPRPVQQPKSHASKVLSTSQTSTVLPQNSISPSSTSNSQSLPAASQPK